jgi:hypothetical protein
MNKFQNLSGPSAVQKSARQSRQAIDNEEDVGGSDLDRTDDLFHAISAT